MNTATNTAVQVAEDLRQALENADLQHDGQAVPLSMSIGVAELGVDGDSLQALLAAADQRLYQAKANGRNQVVPAPVVPLEKSLTY